MNASVRVLVAMWRACAQTKAGWPVPRPGATKRPRTCWWGSTPAAEQSTRKGGRAVKAAGRGRDLPPQSRGGGGEDGRGMMAPTSFRRHVAAAVRPATMEAGS